MQAAVVEEDEAAAAQAAHAMLAVRLWLERQVEGGLGHDA